MKREVLAYVLVGVAIFSLHWQKEINRREWLQNELEQAVQNSVKRVGEEAKKEDSIIRNSNEFVAYMMELILEQCQSDCDMSIQILYADWEKGVLDFRITENHYNSQRELASVRQRIQI